MRAILVSVDYSDILGLTLPWNRHHFTEVMVVTSTTDTRSREVAWANRCQVFATDAFYRDGAVFNKWLALEGGLDAFGRDGWLCIMDADVCWPRDADLSGIVPGNLYTPLRRMMPAIPQEIPAEQEWSRWPLHRQQVEWAGYTQVFFGSDLMLGPPPWHETNWRHAGGADSFFQARWPQSRKLRPPFEVLHIGESGRNWCGRATPYADGTVHPEAASRVAQVRRFVGGRTVGPGRFDREKL